MLGGGGTGATAVESVIPPCVPLNCRLAVRLLPVGAFVMFTPTHRKKRSVLAMVIGAVVEHEKLKRVAVLVIAVVPVPTQKSVPEALFRYSFARGNMVPPFLDSFIERVKVTADPDGMIPLLPGSPAALGNEAMRYSPVAAPLSDCELRVRAVPPGLFVLRNHWPTTPLGFSR